MADPGVDGGRDQRPAVAAGQAALARGAWAEARERFGEALARGETAAAFEGAGLAARYQLDANAAIDLHERGYRLARSRGDAATAARLAIQLCHDAYAFRGPAEASGWVERAALLVEGEPPGVATAWVSLLRAHFALADHRPIWRSAGRQTRSRSRARRAPSTSRCSRSRSTAWRWSAAGRSSRACAGSMPPQPPRSAAR